MIPPPCFDSVDHFVHNFLQSVIIPLSEIHSVPITKFNYWVFNNSTFYHSILYCSIPNSITRFYRIKPIDILLSSMLLNTLLFNTKLYHSLLVLYYKVLYNSCVYYSVVCYSILYYSIPNSITHYWYSIIRFYITHVYITQ